MQRGQYWLMAATTAMVLGAGLAQAQPPAAWAERLARRAPAPLLADRR